MTEQYYQPYDSAGNKYGENRPMNTEPSYWLSKCHGARCRVVSGDEGTSHYECMECGKPCDFYDPDTGRTPDTGKPEDTRPHSRACGWRIHPHGPECHSNCPTCHATPPPATGEADWRWYSFCSAHQTVDSQCAACHSGHWQNENDPEVVEDRKLWETDPDKWRKKHNTHAEGADPLSERVEAVLDGYVENGFEVLDSKGSPERNKAEATAAILALIREELEAIRIEAYHSPLNDPETKFAEIIEARIHQLNNEVNPNTSTEAAE